MRLFEKAFKLPFNLGKIGSHIWDANGEMIGMVPDIEKEIRQEVIDTINGFTNRRMTNNVEYDKDTGFITVDGFKFILIRGWGYLTGVGGLNLPDDEAIAIQDDLAKYIVERLTKK